MSSAQIRVKQITGLQSTLDAIAGIDKVSETFTTTATNGDTGILLSQSARETDAIQVFVNGQKVQQGYSWKKDGVAVTASSLEASTELVWDSTTAGFSLEATDQIQLEYETELGGSVGTGSSTTSTTAQTYTATQANNSGVTRSLAFTVTGSTTGGYLSPNQDRVFLENGSVHKVYRLQNGIWAQEGSDIPFISADQLTWYGNGQRRWSHDGNHISFWDHTANILRVYSWNGSDWQQRGGDITTTDIRAHDINQDGTRIILRDRVHRDANDNHLRTFNWDGNQWQAALTITDVSGATMDPSGNKLAKTTYSSTLPWPEEGWEYTKTTHVYEWSNSQWNLIASLANTGGHGEWSHNGNRLFIITSEGVAGLYEVSSNSISLVASYDNFGSNVISYQLNDTGTRLQALQSRTYQTDPILNEQGQTTGYTYTTLTPDQWFILEESGGTLSRNTFKYATYVPAEFTNPWDVPWLQASANADVSMVLANAGATPEEFYTYTIGNTLSHNNYLDTTGVNIGDTISVYFSTELEYTPVQTAHIYTDIDNWIRVRVIQNTTAQDGLLQVKILEKEGSVQSHSYSITLG